MARGIASSTKGALFQSATQARVLVPDLFGGRWDGLVLLVRLGWQIG